jgi:hypothetical protein
LRRNTAFAGRFIPQTCLFVRQPKALCPLYCTLSPPQPYVSSMALCSLYSPLPLLRPSVPSTALYPSTALCLLYCSLSPLQPSVPSTVFSLYSSLSLYGPLPLFLPIILSTALCTLYGPLPLAHLWSSVLYMALWPLYSPLFPLPPLSLYSTVPSTPSQLHPSIYCKSINDRILVKVYVSPGIDPGC